MSRAIVQEPPWQYRTEEVPNKNPMILGKLQYFTNLNFAAIKVGDFPNMHHHLWVSVEVRS